MAETKADYLGHRRRIKKKYLAGGLTGWPDYEVLELALFYVISRKDTKPLAKELIKRFKNIQAVLDADPKELEKVSGCTAHLALFLVFLKDLAIRYLEQGLRGKDLVSSPREVYDYLRAALKGSQDEELKAIFLNNRNRLLAAETIQRGTVNRSAIYPRKIVERALYHHATGVIISHNHPGESLTPSADDIKVTQALQEALKTVEITLLDHIIIAANGYFSFKENSTIQF